MSAIQNVVVGMSGKVDSFVAAYLLKKQGLNVIGVYVQMVDVNDAFFALPRRPSLRENFSEEKISDDLSYIKEFLPQCNSALLEQARTQAEYLDIPFYAVNALPEYRSIVLDRVISAGILGEKFYPCMFCHQLLVSILEKKAGLLKADKVATGHYARIHYQKIKKIYTVGSSNDALIDQSLKLSQLNQEQLAHLMLPLSEMRREEVLKVAQSISLQVDVSQGDQHCYMQSPHLGEFIERTSSPNLRKVGSVLCYEDDLLVRDHDGIHKFILGEKLPNVMVDQNTTNHENHQIVIQKNMASGTIFVAADKNASFESFALVNVSYNPLLDNSRPKEGLVRTANQTDRWPCTVYFKNNGCVFVELKTRMPGLMSPGTAVGVYENVEKGPRLLLTGVVASIPPLNSVYFSRPADKEIPYVNVALERNKKIGF